jgi:SAM-dependent methyltransferase
MANYIERIPCPVCSSICYDPPLYQYTVEAAAAHFCPVTRSEERNKRLVESIRQLWDRDTCDVLRCPVCKFAFGLPFVGGDEEFYSILHEQRGYPKWRWDYDVAINEALSCVKPGRVLDIGAGAGVFLRSLSTEWERYAMEGSEFTRTELEKSGIHVFRDLSEAVGREAGTFQVITLFQVLEHIAEFYDLLGRCRQLLCDGGQIVVTVPDGDAMIRQERLTGCPDMPPNHINKWSPESLTRALRNTGFQAGRVIHEPSSWRNLESSIHMKLMADAAKGCAAAAQVYRIQNKRLRIMGLACLAVPTLLKMLPQITQLRRGGAFAMIGIAA